MVNVFSATLNKLKVVKTVRDIEREEVIEAINKLRDELEEVHRKFNYTTDTLLIDSIIYEIKSLQKKYEYYIRLCKEKGFIIEGFRKVS